MPLARVLRNCATPVKVLLAKLLQQKCPFATQGQKIRPWIPPYRPTLSLRHWHHHRGHPKWAWPHASAETRAFLPSARSVEPKRTAGGTGVIFAHPKKIKKTDNIGATYRPCPFPRSQDRSHTLNPSIPSTMNAPSPTNTIIFPGCIRTRAS